MLGRQDRVKRRTETNRRAAQLAAKAEEFQAEALYYEQQRRSWVGADTEKTIQELNQRCEAQVTELRAAHAAIEPEDEERLGSGKDPRLEILKSREQALKAELRQLQNGVSKEEVELEPKAIESHTIEDVIKGVSEVEATIEQLMQLTVADQQLTKREEKILHERTELSAALTEQIKAQSLEVVHRPKTGRAAVLEEAASHMQQTNKELMTQLSKFLDRYYPSDTESDRGGVKELLQDLMNRSVTKPQDSWLVLTEHNAVPQSVELLLRAGIAVKDEEDTRRIRLVKFF
eukprot:TRINITY_DN18405_c0_g1_i2.p1 TRINITY_DN18405_c0_g1~~TRINITY_DN18405_c0_g1_i2.p1  ORF type:complete len:289 (+),score=93.31 TRINITY_DN18405_c0_g1_i2:70-936(+)